MLVCLAAVEGLGRHGSPASGWWLPVPHNPRSTQVVQKNPALAAGLPQEVSHTKQALAMGYAFLAINSLDRSEASRCYR